MIIVEVNSVCYGSTGSIGRSIGNIGESRGHIFYYAYPNGRHMKSEFRNANYIPIGGRFSQDVHLVLGRIFGLNGLLSIVTTLKFIRKLRKLKPDLIHLHNIHKNYLNLPLFFWYLRNSNVEVVWTLHDCWSFTGRCPHYQITGCNKWIKGCNHCKYPKTAYPQSYLDTTKMQWRMKRKLFTALPRLTIVTPSNWLANEVRKSFLHEQRVIVINNGIDIDVFKPQDGSKKGCIIGNKRYLVLGVSMDWNISKGIDIFIQLASILSSEYQIVLVGVDSNTRSILPDSIIGIERTESKEELVDLYNCADVFLNPTREDTFPTVNIEALSCGTPVITSNACGAPEIISIGTGIEVKGDISEWSNAIKHVCEDKIIDRKACRERAELFSGKDMFHEYIDLFEMLIQ